VFRPAKIHSKEPGLYGAGATVTVWVRLSPQSLARSIKKITPELLTITEPEVSFRKRGSIAVGEGFLPDHLACPTGDSATALPIALTATTDIATAVPMINCVMLLLRMIASHP
jgi:hypothetical protein